MKINPLNPINPLNQINPLNPLNPLINPLNIYTNNIFNQGPSLFSEQDLFLKKIIAFIK